MRGTITSHAPYQARYTWIMRIRTVNIVKIMTRISDWCDQFDADDNEMITGDGYEQERGKLLKPCQ